MNSLPDTKKKVLKPLKNNINLVFMLNSVAVTVGRTRPAGGLRLK